MLQYVCQSLLCVFLQIYLPSSIVFVGNKNNRKYLKFTDQWLFFNLRKPKRGASLRIVYYCKC